MRFLGLALFAVLLLTSSCSETSTKKELANFDQTGNALLGISGCERQVNKFVRVPIPAEKLSASDVYDACYTARFRIPDAEEDGLVFAAVDAEGHLMALGISYDLERVMDGASAEVVAESFWDALEERGCEHLQRSSQRSFCYAQTAARIMKDYLDTRSQEQAMRIPSR